jgi:hypothetical protein
MFFGGMGTESWNGDGYCVPSVRLMMQQNNKQQYMFFLLS